MKITRIINDDMVIAQEEQADEAKYWQKQGARGEGELLFAALENAFGIIERRFGIGSSDVSLLTYRRFAEHMRTSVRRALRTEDRGTATDGALGRLIREHMPDCYECAGEIRNDLERRSGARLPEDELLDLMLHVHKVVASGEKRGA